MDFAGRRVRKLALPIKHHIKEKLQIEEKPENLKCGVFLPQLQQHFSPTKEPTALF